VTVDIDAGNTITVTIDDEDLRELRRFQLNNLYSMPEAYLIDQYRDLRHTVRVYVSDNVQTEHEGDLASWLSEGYTVYPVQPVNTPVAAPGSGVRLDNFVASELAILDAKIAEAERSGRIDHTTDRAYTQLYTDRARLQESRHELLAAAVDYASSLRYGLWWSCREVTRILPLLDDASQLAAAISAAFSALTRESQFSWDYMGDLYNLSVALTEKGLGAAGDQVRQFIRDLAARPGALQAVGKAVNEARGDPQSDDLFRHHLATTLYSLGVTLLELARPSDALPVITEAVGIYRELAASKMDRYGPGLANSLNLLAQANDALGDTRSR
jgi:hypothetical protein